MKKSTYWINTVKKGKISNANYWIPTANIWQINFTAEFDGMLIYWLKESKYIHILIAAEWQYTIKN